MLHSKFRGNRSTGTRDFFRFFTIYGHCGNFGHVTSIITNFCPPPFRRKEEGHCFRLFVLPSPYSTMYLVCATPPTVLCRFFQNFTDVFVMV